MIYVDPDPPMANYQLYMPMVFTIDNVKVCFGSIKAYEFYRLLKDDYRQKRTKLLCHPKLVQVAKKRAYGLATGDPWGHIDRNGVTLHEYVRNEGLILPDSYPVKGNYVESIVAGTDSTQSAFNALMLSTSHYPHLTGNSDIFVKQHYCGIAMYTGGEYSFYWSIVIAEIATSGE